MSNEKIILAITEKEDRVIIKGIFTSLDLLSGSDSWKNKHLQLEGFELIFPKTVIYTISSLFDSLASFSAQGLWNKDSLVTFVIHPKSTPFAFNLNLINTNNEVLNLEHVFNVLDLTAIHVTTDGETISVFLYNIHGECAASVLGIQLRLK